MNQIQSLIAQWDIQCIIFDLDGTLVDTLDKHIKAFEILFKQLKVDISYEAISENMGRTPKDTLLSLVPEMIKDETKLIELADLKETILTDLLEKVPLFDGAKNLLSYLYQTKIPLCLASSTPLLNVEKMLQTANIYHFFKIIITGEDITIGKPNPQVFLKAAAKAQIDPSNCLVIGDYPHDIDAARNAGMKIIAVQTGKHRLDKIKDLKVNLLITSLVELLSKHST